MLRKILTACALIAFPGVAEAKPTYLTCEFSKDGKPFVVEVAADEENGTVSLYMPSTGNRQKLTGTFTSDQVIFSDRMMSYVLSRVDLSIVRDVPIIKSHETGQCKLAPAPERAF